MGVGGVKLLDVGDGGGLVFIIQDVFLLVRPKTDEGICYFI